MEVLDKIKKIYILCLIVFISACGEQTSYKIDDDYLFFDKGKIQSINNTKKITKVILDTNQVLKGINMTAGLGTYFVIDENMIYYKPIFSQYTFSYDITTKRFTKMFRGNIVAYSYKYKILFYQYEQLLYQMCLNSKVSKVILKLPDDITYIDNYGVVLVDDKSLFYNIKDAVYSYNILTEEKKLTNIKSCKLVNIYRTKDNSILCYENISNRYYMLSLNTYDKYYFHTEMSFPFFYDNKLDVLFYSKLQFSLSSKSLEKYITMVYDFNQKKSFFYNDGYVISSSINCKTAKNIIKQTFTSFPIFNRECIP